MAETLLQVYADIARPCGLDPTITSFSESDGSASLVQYILEAYRFLRKKLPKETPQFVGSGSLSLVDGTRTYTLASDALGYGVYDWSMVNTTSSNDEIEEATPEYIKENFSDYTTLEGQPDYFYFEGTSIAFYPVPDASYTVTYKYQKTLTEDTSTTATFLIPDDWLDFVKKYAKYLWQDAKEFGDPEKTQADALDLLHTIKVEIWHNNPTYMIAPRVT